MVRSSLTRYARRTADSVLVLRMTTMQKIRVVLLLGLLPLAPTLGKRGFVGWRAVQGVWAQGQYDLMRYDLTRIDSLRYGTPSPAAATRSRSLYWRRNLRGVWPT